MIRFGRSNFIFELGFYPTLYNDERVTTLKDTNNTILIILVELLKSKPLIYLNIKVDIATLIKTIIRYDPRNKQTPLSIVLKYINLFKFHR